MNTFFIQIFENYHWRWVYFTSPHQILSLFSLVKTKYLSFGERPVKFLIDKKKHYFLKIVLLLFFFIDKNFIIIQIIFQNLNY